jgi:3-oxoacyl-[acyl-carrier protein] reductase
MNLELKDKVVLVTGASRGIGLGIALGFAREGARIAITGRDRHSLADAVKKIEDIGGVVHSYAGDMRDETEICRCVEEVVDKWGGLDILIANLGAGKGQRGWDVDESEWNELLDLNLLSGVKATKVSIPHLMKSKSGAIVFISSIAGLEHFGAPPAYEAGKAGVIAYSKYLARTLAKEKLRVNVVAPGNILFPGSTWDEKLKAGKEAVQAMIQVEVPMNRFGSPEDVANAVLFLASEKAGFVTGSCLVVDGGQTRSFL